MLRQPPWVPSEWADLVNAILTSLGSRFSSNDHLDVVGSEAIGVEWVGPEVVDWNLVHLVFGTEMAGARRQWIRNCRLTCRSEVSVRGVSV